MAHGMSANSIRITADNEGIDLNSGAAAMVDINRYLTVAERLWRKNLLSRHGLPSESESLADPKELN